MQLIRNQLEVIIQKEIERFINEDLLKEIDIVINCLIIALLCHRQWLNQNVFDENVQCNCKLPRLNSRVRKKQLKHETEKSTEKKLLRLRAKPTRKFDSDKVRQQVQYIFREIENAYVTRNSQ